MAKLKREDEVIVIAGKDKGKRRVHVEQLKLRTRCRRCRQIGHWERECQNPPAAQASKPESRAFFVGPP